MTGISELAPIKRDGHRGALRNKGDVAFKFGFDKIRKVAGVKLIIKNSPKIKQRAIFKIICGKPETIHRKEFFQLVLRKQLSMDRASFQISLRNRNAADEGTPVPEYSFYFFNHTVQITKEIQGEIADKQPGYRHDDLVKIIMEYDAWAEKNR